MYVLLILLMPWTPPRHYTVKQNTMDDVTDKLLHFHYDCDNTQWQRTTYVMQQTTTSRQQSITIGIVCFFYNFFFFLSFKFLFIGLYDTNPATNDKQRLGHCHHHDTKRMIGERRLQVELGNFFNNRLIICSFRFQLCHTNKHEVAPSQPHQYSSLILRDRSQVTRYMHTIPT